eukprot:TRINITY_DN5352_c1_g1_i1.p1 TRINITY_DN5352_c1_g1~~TRINITY_DN5352_c1_g1_i1.p1  ORF type:complete len:70 (+),score=21.26 TRINITY_DN5352_c1_g1_i1:319-528(+)
MSRPYRIDVVKIEDFNGEPMFDLASPDISDGNELYYVPISYTFENSASTFFLEIEEQYQTGAMDLNDGA